MKRICTVNIRCIHVLRLVSTNYSVPLTTAEVNSQDHSPCKRRKLSVMKLMRRYTEFILSRHHQSSLAVLLGTEDRTEDKFHGLPINVRHIVLCYFASFPDHRIRKLLLSHSGG